MLSLSALHRRIVGAAFIGLACLSLFASDVRAGTLIINITDGTTSYDIFDQLPPDVNGNPNQIQVDPAGLIFADFNIVGLTASSNNPGENNPGGAVLTIGGTVERTTGGGPVTLTITTYQTEFTLPQGPAFQMISTTSNTTTNVPGGSTVSFESWYNSTSPAVPPPPFGIPAPPIFLPLPGTGEAGDTTMIGGLPPSPSFSLTNQIELTIGGATGGTVPRIVFGGQTQLLAIPEPSSVILLGCALPLGLLVTRKIRRSGR